MTVIELSNLLGGNILTGSCGTDNTVSGAYSCDLLSWVMSHAGKGDAWITVHTHLNTVAVALLTELSCIVVPEDIQVEQATLDKAMEEGIPVISCSINAYEICGKMYQALKG